MKVAKNFVTTTLVLFALSLPVLAGDQQTPGYTPPPPSSTLCSTSVDEQASMIDESTPLIEPETSDVLWLDVITAMLTVY